MKRFIMEFKQFVKSSNIHRSMIFDQQANLWSSSEENSEENSNDPMITTHDSLPISINDSKNIRSILIW